MADALLGGIIINEVLPDPNSATGSTGPRFDTDGNGSVTAVDEFIEIMNISTAAINIGGLQLWDQTLGNYFAFPAGTILQPGGHAMVMTGAKLGPGPTLGPNDQAFYVGRGSAVLNNGSDTTILYSPAQQEFIQIAYGGGTITTPTGTAGNFPGFPSGTSRVGAGENFGSVVPGNSIQRSPDGSSIFVNNQLPTPSSTNVCFAAGSLISTPTGECLVEDLRIGDLVQILDGPAQPIQWIGQRHITGAELQADPRLWPVRFLPGSLGPDMPRRSLRLSRQHRLRLSGKIIARMTGQPSAFVPAVALLGLPGVDSVMPQRGLTYFHILLAQHSVVLCEIRARRKPVFGKRSEACVIRRRSGRNRADSARGTLAAEKARRRPADALRRSRPPNVDAFSKKRAPDRRLSPAPRGAR